MNPTLKEEVSNLQSDVAVIKSDMDHLRENIDSRIKHKTTAPSTEKRLSSLESDAKTKVTYKQFYWIVGIMMTILMSVLGYMINQMNYIQEQQYEVAREVSEINGELKSTIINFKPHAKEKESKESYSPYVS